VDLLRGFIRREFNTRYLGSISGLLWVLIHPVALLLLYGFLFGTVFQTRLPGVPQDALLAYVAVALWPWLMFSEGLNRATMAVQDHSALLGKVAVPAGLLVVANLCATFILHTVGYVFVILVLWLLGYPLLLPGLLWLPVGLALLFALTLGLALLTSAVQVLIRDLAQVLAQLMGFWFFLTPILYGRSQLPAALQPIFDLNPLTFHAEAARAALLQQSVPPIDGILKAAILSGIVLLLGSWVFRRLRRHFEDFL
jgi:ABC-type polysaccharide/polyol phosphate export permease